MNKPKIEEYMVFNKEGMIVNRFVNYTLDLEKYCNELEQTIQTLKETIEEMEQEQIERADLELEHMYGEDW